MNDGAMCHMQKPCRGFKGLVWVTRAPLTDVGKKNPSCHQQFSNACAVHVHHLSLTHTQRVTAPAPASLFADVTEKGKDYAFFCVAPLQACPDSGVRQEILLLSCLSARHTFDASHSARASKSYSSTDN